MYVTQIIYSNWVLTHFITYVSDIYAAEISDVCVNVVASGVISYRLNFCDSLCF